MLPIPSPQSTQNAGADENRNQNQSMNPSQDPNSAQNRQRGTGFVNINKIINANQGAGQKMGQTIGNSLSNQAGQVRQGIQQGQNQFQAGMQQGSTGANQAIQQGQALTQGANESATDYANRLAQQDSNALGTQGKALQTAAYTGPQGLQNSNQIQANAATASALGRLGTTGAGQAQLLSSQVAQRGNYGQGQSALDQLLLGQGGQGAIQRGSASLANIGNQASNAVMNAQNQASATGSAINANKTNALQAIQNQLSGTGDTGTKGFTQLAKEQAASTNKNAQRLQELLNGKNAQGADITPETFAAETPEQQAADRALIENMGQYGIGNAAIFGLDQQEMQGFGNVLGQLTGNANFAQNQQYLGNQGQAAQNLASFLGDQATQKQISNATSGDNAFKQGNIFNAGAQETAMKQNLEAKQQADTAMSLAQHNLDLRKKYDYDMARANYLGTQSRGGGAGYYAQAQADIGQLKDQMFDPNKNQAQINAVLNANRGTMLSPVEAALKKLGLTGGNTGPVQAPVTTEQPTNAPNPLMRIG